MGLEVDIWLMVMCSMFFNVEVRIVVVVGFLFV